MQNATTYLGYAIAAILIAAVAVLPWRVMESGRAAQRVFTQFLFVILLPLTVIMGSVLFVLGLAVDLDERVWAAVIAGVVIASGWLTTAIFAALDQSRDRAERTRDYHKALYAEIGNALASLYQEGASDRYGQEIVERMQADPAFVPFIPKSHFDHVFDGLVDNIEALPRQTIDAVVAYYTLIKSISAFEADMRGARFQGLEGDRKILIYQDYLGMRKRAFELGQDALRLIKAYSDGGPAAADAKLKELNTRVADPRSPQQGSE